VGEIISASTGTPSPLYRASLWFSTTNSIVLENVRVRYAVVGCSINPGASATLRHLQFTDCATALEKFSDTALHNVLIANSGTGVRGYSTSLQGQHLTGRFHLPASFQG
jgi:hypothetical protein